MNHIELFSGCGGLCLGLKAAGFELLMANELSPMASETFSYNILRENLADYPEASQHTLWLSSNFPRAEMKRRLREDPRTFPDGINSDLSKTGDNLDGSLVVGNIIAFNKWLKDHKTALRKIKKSFGKGEVDLISGGPPCQSFSLAGLREKNNEKNSLPWNFAEFVDMIQSKIVLLENVSGILRPFTENGKKYHAWFEISKAFAKIGYIPLPLHINAKFAGTAQNRPRFILICIRKNIFRKLCFTFNQIEQCFFEQPFTFFNKIVKNQCATINDLSVLDLNSNKAEIFKSFSKSFLEPLASQKKIITVKQAIGDLSVTDKQEKSAYVKLINRRFGRLVPKADLANFEIKDNDPRVKRRFRIYQNLAKFENKTAAKQVSQLIAGKINSLSKETWKEAEKYEYLDKSGAFFRFRTKKAFESYLMEHLSKKQSQRALIANAPAPAVLSTPDDACHYSDLRTLTPREMARIQSFPDNFVFRSKTTTGGLNRRFEVPVFTQIGNAVPVQLSFAIGLCIRNLLTRLQ